MLLGEEKCKSVLVGRVRPSSAAIIAFRTLRAAMEDDDQSRPSHERFWNIDFRVQVARIRAELVQSRQGAGRPNGFLKPYLAEPCKAGDGVMKTTDGMSPALIAFIAKPRIWEFCCSAQYNCCTAQYCSISKCHSGRRGRGEWQLSAQSCHWDQHLRTSSRPSRSRTRRPIDGMGVRVRPKRP